MCLLTVLLLGVILSCLPALAAAEGDPVILQQQGIERIERFIDTFRRTGDRTTLLGELPRAAAELTTSYEAFIARGDLAPAALSVIKLGDIYRMQDAWPQAIDLYSRAYKLARQAQHPAYQAQALLGRARAALYGLRDYGTASADIDQALALSAQLAEKGALADALDYQGQVQVSRGELIAAADTFNRALEVARQVGDQTRVFFAYLGRAEIYQKLAEKCDYQRSFEPCYEAMQHAKADYQRAREIARQLQ
jgi:tetratricopeptide (TPR) repeat protein